MFYCSKFSGDISKWDVSKVTDMSYMFNGNVYFDSDISGWDVSNVTSNKGIFNYCPIKERYKPDFKYINY